MEEKSNAKVQWEKLKGQPFSEKLRYFLEYYGIYLGIAGVALLVVLVAFLGSGTTGLRHVVSGVMFNLNYEGSTGPISDVICEKCGYDSKKCDAEFQTMMLSDDNPQDMIDQTEAVYARIVSGDLDFICGPFAFLENYLSKEKLLDCDVLMLSEIFKPELIEKLDASGRLYYLDTDFNGRTAFYIDISDSYITEALNVKTKEYYMGFACNTKHKQELTAMVEAILE